MNNRNRNKPKPKKSTVQRSQRRKKLNNNQQAINTINNRVAVAKSKVLNSDESVAMSDFVRTLLHWDQPLSTAPLEPRKLFYKRVKYQDTIVVNSSGNCFVGGQMGALPQFNTSSTASPILYANQTGYSPTSTTNFVTGGCNLSIIGTTGVNLSGASVSRAYVQAAHLRISLTGVSNLNKQGQIHIAEDIDDSVRYDTAAGTTQNNLLLNEYPIQDLPKCTTYKRIDVANMDSKVQLEYHYIPLSLYNGTIEFTPATMSAGTQVVPGNKTFMVIAASCATGTTLRLEYEIDLAMEIENDYINDYPPIWSKIYMNPDPTLMLLNQNPDYIISTELDKSTIFLDKKN